MDQPQYTSLLAAGLASGHQTTHAIAQWVVLLRAVLLGLTRLPSESTLLRTLWLINVDVLEQAVAGLTQPQLPADTAASQVVTPCGARLQAQAINGKTLRGATNCGALTHLMSLVQHGSGVTLTQPAVAHKRSKLSAVPLLLAGRYLTDTITTSDALHTQRGLAQTIHERHGFYFLFVKANQPQLRDAMSASAPVHATSTRRAN